MTKRDVFVDADMMMNVLMWVEGWDGRVPTPTLLKPKVTAHTHTDEAKGDRSEE